MGGIYFYCDAGDTIAPVTEKGRAGVFTDSRSSFLHTVNLFFYRWAAVFILSRQWRNNFSYLCG